MQRSNVWIYVPGYVASLLAVGSGVAAVTLTADVPQLTAAMFGFLALGHAASFCARLGARWLRVARIIVVTAAWIVTPLLFLSPAQFFVPAEVSGDPDLQVAIFMGWVAVASTYLVGSYVMERPLPLMFPLVPTFSVFGLVAGLNINTEITGAFITFLFATLFLISYEHLVERAQTNLEPLGGVQPVISRQFAACAILFVPIVGVALLLGMVFQRLIAPLMPFNMSNMRDRMASYMIPADTYANSFTTLQLRGGNILLSDRPVLRVRSEAPFVFLRGRAYTRYTGRGWQSDDRDPDTYTPVSPDANGYFWTQTAPLRPGHRFITQQIVPLGRGAYTIYGSGTIYRFRGNTPEVRVTKTGAVYTRLALPMNQPYEVVSAVFEGTVPQLVSLPGVRSQSAWSEYLYVPPETAQVARLARQVAGKEPTPWKKAEAIAHFLAAECTYSLQTNLYPLHEEPVTYFVLHEKRGACDMFASAMALMLRAVGVPSRVATGYLVTDQEVEEGGWLTMREKDAHAWVEFYLPPYGWIPYDPTAGTRTDENSLSQKLSRMLASMGDQRAVRTYGLPALGVALMCLVWGAPLLKMFQQSQRHRRRPPHPDDYRGWFMEVYRAMNSRLRRWGLPRAVQQTPWEYASALRQERELPDETVASVADITDKFVEARYSEHPITRADVLEARAKLKRLKRREK
jgi:transglutaminase-like putative cysteine protease